MERGIYSDVNSERLWDWWDESISPALWPALYLSDTMGMTKTMYVTVGHGQLVATLSVIYHIIVTEMDDQSVLVAVGQRSRSEAPRHYPEISPVTFITAFIHLPVSFPPLRLAPLQQRLMQLCVAVKPLCIIAKLRKNTGAAEQR